MTVHDLFPALTTISWQQLVMIAVGLTLIYLAIVRRYEPTLLLPMGFGTLLVNIPLSSAAGPDGALTFFFEAGIKTEAFPLLIFIAIGAMIDFSPLFTRPFLLLFGAAAQFGIFATMAVAMLLGFDPRQAASIGIIGAADGPTSIVVATRLAPDLLGPISVAAYSYMALVPIIQPPVIRALTTRRERTIHMPAHADRVAKPVLVLFPIVVTLAAAMVAPSATALIGFLMFGNLIRECGVLQKLSQAAQNELASLVTILLGLSISATMSADRFLRLDTLMIIGLGLLAFVFDTAGGVLFAKALNLALPAGRRVNPMLGACGISAFPMSARVIHGMGQQEDPFNHLLMPAVSANVSGQIGSVLAGGVLLSLVPLLL